MMTFSVELAKAPISQIASDLVRVLSAPNDDEKGADLTPVTVIAAKVFDDGSLVWIACDEKGSTVGSSAKDVSDAAEQIDEEIARILPTESLRRERLVFDVSVRESGLADHVLAIQADDPEQMRGFDVLPPQRYLPLGHRRARRLLRSGRFGDFIGNHMVYFTDRTVFDPSFSDQVPMQPLREVRPEPELWYPPLGSDLHVVVSDASMTHLESSSRVIMGTAWVSSSGDWSVREMEVDRARRQIGDINSAELIGIVDAVRAAFDHQVPHGSLVVLCDNTRAVQLARAVVDHDGTRFRYSRDHDGLDLDELLSDADVEVLLQMRPVISWLPKNREHPLHVAVDALTRLRASRAGQIVHTQSAAFRALRPR